MEAVFQVYRDSFWMCQIYHLFQGMWPSGKMWNINTKWAPKAKGSGHELRWGSIVRDLKMKCENFTLGIGKESHRGMWQGNLHSEVQRFCYIKDKNKSQSCIACKFPVNENTAINSIDCFYFQTEIYVLILQIILLWSKR